MRKVHIRSGSSSFKDLSKIVNIMNDKIMNEDKKNRVSSIDEDGMISYGKKIIS